MFGMFPANYCSHMPVFDKMANPVIQFNTTNYYNDDKGNRFQWQNMYEIFLLQTATHHQPH